MEKDGTNVFGIDANLEVQVIANLANSDTSSSVSIGDIVSHNGAVTIKSIMDVQTGTITAQESNQI